MKRALAPITILGLALTGCGGATEASGPPKDGYKKFSEVDPYTSGYFIALEDEGSDPVTYNGHAEDTVYVQLAWTYGVAFCEDLDAGKSVKKSLIELKNEVQTSADYASLAGAAAGNICTHNKEQVQKWVDNN